MTPPARTRRARAARLEIKRAVAAEHTQIADIVTSLPDALWSAELSDGRLLYVSPGANEVFGCTPKALLAQRALSAEWVHPEDQATVLRAWKTLPTTGSFDVEYRVAGAGGANRWINDRARVVRGGAGAALQVVGLARDITVQVAQRRRIARLYRLREFTSSVNAALIRLRNRDALFTEICRTAVEYGGLRGAQIALLDATTGWISLAASAGASAGPGSADRIRVEPAVGIVAQSIRSGKPETCSDSVSETDPRQDDPLLGEGIRSAASFPLQVDGRIIGALSLNADEPAFFDDTEVRLLQALAINIGTALEFMLRQDRHNHHALFDALTGLPNRTLFRDRLTQALEAERRGSSRLALMLFDIERFKTVNDTFGQHCGDRLLQQIAAGLRAAIGDINHVARLGGDVFAIMFPAVHDASNVATALREQAARIFREPFVIDGQELHMNLKAGIAIFPEDGTDADALFRNAEAALERARETGERYLFYAPEINARVSERMELELGLRRAIERREFVLHYQPKVELDGRRIVGLEALVRWQRPGKGLVSPGMLIPVLEQTGMILEVGQQVMVEAVATYRGWRERGLHAPRIAVNVSTLQLQQSDFCASVRAAIAGSEPCGLDLEVTESLLMHNMDDAIRKLREVRTLGIGVSLDDFGTGYSSLAHLARLPVDTLKIDRTFINRMTDSPDDTSVVTAILALGRSLNRTVIAEGVETEEQARLLRLLRCDQMQGHLFSPPLPLARLELLIFS